AGSLTLSGAPPNSFAHSGASMPPSKRILTPTSWPRVLRVRACATAVSMTLSRESGPPGVGCNSLHGALTTNDVTAAANRSGGGPSRSISPWIVGLRLAVAGVVAEPSVARGVAVLLAGLLPHAVRSMIATVAIKGNPRRSSQRDLSGTVQAYRYALRRRPRHACTTEVNPAVGAAQHALVHVRCRVS